MPIARSGMCSTRRGLCGGHLRDADGSAGSTCGQFSPPRRGSMFVRHSPQQGDREPGRVVAWLSSEDSFDHRHRNRSLDGPGQPLPRARCHARSQFSVVARMHMHAFLLWIGIRIGLAQRQRRLMEAGQNQLLLVRIVGDIAHRKDARP